MTAFKRSPPWLMVAAVATAGIGALVVALMSGAPPLSHARVLEVGRPSPSTLRDGVARQFLTQDSVELQGQQLVARSRGTVIIVHGLGEHDSAYVQLAAGLVSASGMNVVAFTLRGNGYGTLPAGDVPDTEAYLRDIGGLVHELQRRTPSGPVVLVGVEQGAGLAARYASESRALQLPRVQGIALIRPITSRESLKRQRVGYGAPVEWHDRRMATLDWLNRLSLSAFNGLPVAHQLVPGGNGVAVRHYTYRALLALSIESVWVSLQSAAVPSLVLTAVRPAGSEYPISESAEWTALPDTDAPTSSTALAALSRWTAQFSAEAELPPAVLPYQPLPIIEPTR